MRRNLNLSLQNEYPQIARTRIMTRWTQKKIVPAQLIRFLRRTCLVRIKRKSLCRLTISTNFGWSQRIRMSQSKIQSTRLCKCMLILKNKRINLISTRILLRLFYQKSTVFNLENLSRQTCKKCFKNIFKSYKFIKIKYIEILLINILYKKLVLVL